MNNIRSSSLVDSSGRCHLDTPLGSSSCSPSLSQMRLLLLSSKIIRIVIPFPAATTNRQNGDGRFVGIDHHHYHHATVLAVSDRAMTSEPKKDRQLRVFQQDHIHETTAISRDIALYVCRSCFLEKNPFLGCDRTCAKMRTIGGSHRRRNGCSDCVCHPSVSVRRKIGLAAVAGRPTAPRTGRLPRIASRKDWMGTKPRRGAIVVPHPSHKTHRNSNETKTIIIKRIIAASR